MRIQHKVASLHQVHSGTPKCKVVTPLWQPCKDHQSYKVFYLAQFLFTVWMAGNFGCVEQRQAVLVMSSIFFYAGLCPWTKILESPLSYALSISLCACLPHHLGLSLTHCTCTTSSVTFPLPPLVTLWLFLLFCLSAFFFSLPQSLVCIAVFQNLLF